MRGYRVVLAFLVAPMLTVVAALLVYAAHTGAPPPAHAARGIFRYFGFVAYTVTAIFGPPAYLLLRRSRFGGKLAASVYGGMLALAVSYVLFAMVPGFFIADNTKGYLVYGPAGAASGLLFWIIASGRETEGP